MSESPEIQRRVAGKSASPGCARNRLRALLLVACPLLAALRPARSAPRVAAPLRIGTTAVILDDQVAFLHDWQRYLEQRLERNVVFVQRGSYREITALLSTDQIDAAWVCGYPYVANRASMRLLTVPLYNGRPLYQSYLIVPRSDSATRSYADLRGRIFAYSDPNSNSGFLVPQYMMLRAGLDPGKLFRKSFFTWAHKKVVSAVATGVADGGAVDGYVWETLAGQTPDLTAQTRVVEKSPEFGFPPLVTRASLGQAEFSGLQSALIGMANDAAGRGLLKRLNLTGFAPDDPRVFEGIEQALAYVSARERLPQ